MYQPFQLQLFQGFPYRRAAYLHLIGQSSLYQIAADGIGAIQDTIPNMVIYFCCQRLLVARVKKHCSNSYRRFLVFLL